MKVSKFAFYNHQFDVICDVCALELSALIGFVEVHDKSAVGTDTSPWGFFPDASYVALLVNPSE